MDLEFIVTLIRIVDSVLSAAELLIFELHQKSHQVYYHFCVNVWTTFVENIDNWLRYLSSLITAATHVIWTNFETRGSYL